MATASSPKVDGHLNEPDLLRLLDKWGREELKTRFPKLFHFLGSLDGQNVGLIAAALSHLAATDLPGQLTQWLGGLLSPDQNSPKEPGNILQNLLSQLAASGECFINEHGANCIEMLQIITGAILALNTATEAYQLFRKFREGSNLSAQSQVKVNALTGTFEQIVAQMFDLDRQWEQLKRNLISGRRRLRSLKRFEMQVDALDQEVAEAIVEVKSLQVQIGDNIVMLEERRAGKLLQGIFNVAAAAGSVGRLQDISAGLPGASQATLFGNILYTAEFVTAIANSTMATYNLGSVVIDWTELKKLRKQLADVLEIRACLVEFQKNLRKMRQWIVEQVEEDEDEEDEDVQVFIESNQLGQFAQLATQSLAKAFAF